eukprot:scaffold28338_cov63-Phaeocystis_antarctica.AAC.7
MLRAATMGPPAPPPVAADWANAGAAVVDTRLTLKSCLAAPTAACMEDGGGGTKVASAPFW